jgi:signal transduction histidine kinase
MMPHEIRPKQLRALLLLLVVVPLIPAALMVRFMVDTLRNERLAALDRVQQLHSETLSIALRGLTETGGADLATAAQQVVSTLEKLAGPQIRARAVDTAGQLLAGAVEPWGQPVAQSTSPALPGVVVQLYLVGPQVLDEAIADQRQVLVWTGSLTTFAVILIAGLAAWTLNRQLALSELKNTSVATVAHELRTPLASMRMLVDTLRERRYRGDEQLHEYLALIATENERLSRLAENFLTFSRLERGTQLLRLESVAPLEVAVAAVQPLRARLEAPGVTFTLAMPDALPPVRGDREALAQVLTNLLDNALKYTTDPKRITLKAEQRDAVVAFIVEDNGLGMNAEERRAIFEPFYQVDQRLSRSGSGCGLGLSIVRRLVAAHEGEITVAAEPGKGSVFTVKIPLA